MIAVHHSMLGLLTLLALFFFVPAGIAHARTSLVEVPVRRARRVALRLDARAGTQRTLVARGVTLVRR